MWALLATFLPAIIGALLLSFLLTALVRQVALKFKVMAAPRKRDMHLTPTPRLGGVAIVLSFLLVFGLVGIFFPELIWFTNEVRLGLDRHLLGLVTASLVLLVFGIADDIYNLSPGKQILGQIVAASLVIFSGIGIDYISNPLGPSGSIISLNQITFSLFSFGNYQASITLWSDLFTLIWLVGMMNVMNWFDGLDGLAGGVSGIAALMLLILSIIVGSPVGIVVMLAILMGSLIGFIPWNWYPAKIFMGTSGSTFLGFILGVASIIAGGKIATALLVLGVPVLDAVWVILRRAFKGKPIFLPDRKHIHHRLVDAGVSVRKTVLILYSISFVFGALALWRNNISLKLQLALVLALLMVLIGLSTVVVEKIKLNNKHG